MCTEATQVEHSIEMMTAEQDSWGGREGEKVRSRRPGGKAVCSHTGGMGIFVVTVRQPLAGFDEPGVAGSDFSLLKRAPDADWGLG